MITSFLYPQGIHYYDSERRDRESITKKSYGPTEDRVYNFNYVQHIPIDYTDHVSEESAYEFTYQSLANGCKMKFKTWLQSETDDTWYIPYKLVIEDNEGNDITGEAKEQVFQNPYYNLTGNVTLPKTKYPNKNHIVLDYGTELDYTDASSSIYYLNSIIQYRNVPWQYETPPDLTGTMKESTFDYFYFKTNIGQIDNNATFERFKNFIIEHGDGTPITPILPSEDESTPGGGDDANPDYNPFSDPVDFPGLPTGGGAIASGFIRVYNPTAGQLQSLASKLWSNNFYDTIEKIMNDPMEAMISLHSVPFSIVGGANANIEVGNYDTEISAKTVTTQYYTLDCGNISLPEHWASALDYSPYTTVDCFIPFVGVRPLQIDDVMGRVLNLKYNIDILTGSAIAMLKCGDSVLYTYNTQIHSEIPYTMSSYGRLIQSIVGVAGTAIGATAGGAGAVIGGAMGGALGTAMTKHSDVSRGGSLGGAVGVMGDFIPYLIIHRPIQSLAGDFASKKGYPANISATLGSLSGYTVVDKIHLTGIDCTDTERDEIHALLKDGVII